ncbi:uncharacterized protein FIBRA_02310 [Fibroporia radiculosa]|uniref:Uncharacterized protein n=1 Tax=Fibroporia radiculosa TaxID=599839 RepID=J4GMS7_9APHY|nr:uncharacterized protein FIBRA_02310 [Fibroporia radiculosa]CCM00280.1 predicted protein [Fibroporia radiculosa]
MHPTELTVQMTSTVLQGILALQSAEIARLHSQLESRRNFLRWIVDMAADAFRWKIWRKYTKNWKPKEKSSWEIQGHAVAEQLRDCEARLDKLRAEYNGVRHSLATLMDKNTMLSVELQTAMEYQSEWEEEKAAINSQLSSEKAEKEKLRNEVSLLLIEKGGLEAQIHSTVKCQKQFQEENATLRATLSTEKERQEDILAQKAALEVRLQESEARANTFLEQIAHEQDQNRRLMHRADDLEDRVQELEISDATVQSLLTLQSTEITRLRRKIANNEFQLDKLIGGGPLQDSDCSDVRVLREQLCDLVDKIKPIPALQSVSEELEVTNKLNAELQMNFDKLNSDFDTLLAEKNEISGMLLSEKESKAALEEDLAQSRADHEALLKRIHEQERELENTHKDYQACISITNIRAEWAVAENDVKEQISLLLNELDDQNVMTNDLRQHLCEMTTESNVERFLLHEQLELYRKAQTQKTKVHVEELDVVRAELAACRAELEAAKAKLYSTPRVLDDVVPGDGPPQAATSRNSAPLMTSLTLPENLDKIKAMFRSVTGVFNLESFAELL